MMPVWEFDLSGEPEPEDLKDSVCRTCLADLPNDEPHESWCPEK